MSHESKPKNFSWVFMTAAASFFIFAALCFCPDFPSLPEFSPQDSGFSYLDDSELPKEERASISIYDYSPVFLVTGYNYAGAEEAIPTLSIPDEIPHDSPQDLMRRFREEYALVDENLDIMHGLLNSYTYSNFMQNSADAKIPESAGADATLSVMSASNGKTVFTKGFKPHSVPAGRMWTPVSMSLFVAEDASWSVPVMITSSGLDALDRELDGYVLENVHAMKLKKGYYIITLYP